MSWDLTVRSATGSLGDLESVGEVISRLFPSARFGVEPSGADKVRAAEAQGIKFPEVIRESLISRPATRVAELDTADVSFCFRFASGEVVQEVGLEIRGSGDPFPLLRRLAGIPGWQVFDDATGRTLGEDAEAYRTGWQTYQRMLAQARKGRLQDNDA
jgi:hypothetical protein